MSSYRRSDRVRYRLEAAQERPSWLRRAARSVLGVVGWLLIMCAVWAAVGACVLVALLVLV